MLGIRSSVFSANCSFFCSHRSLKKREWANRSFVILKKTYKKHTNNMIFVQFFWANRLFFVSERGNERFTHLLIYHEHREQIAYGRSFDMSDLSEWVNERSSDKQMREFPTLRVPDDPQGCGYSQHWPCTPGYLPWYQEISLLYTKYQNIRDIGVADVLLDILPGTRKYSITPIHRISEYQRYWCSHVLQVILPGSRKNLS